MRAAAIDGRDLKRLFRAGSDWVAQHIDAINRMNVFPVPDGDTGINMHHTLQRAMQEIAALDSRDAALIAERFAYGALMGARGNSGTILSQWLTGFARRLQPAEPLSPPQFIAACQSAAALAYAAVAEPVEGTMLTVAREAAEALAARPAPPATLSETLHLLTQAAEESLHSTPNLLPILKEADVLDSGGMGLFLFLQGMSRRQSGRGEPAPPAASPRATGSAPPANAAGYGYDVQFLMLGEGLNLPAIRRDFERLGQSVIVVGDSSTIKVHIHVDNPALPFDYAIRTGAELDDIVVENMQRQAQQSSAPPASPAIAVIAVASGAGLRALFEDLNCAAVIAGGQSMNPSLEEFLQVIDRLPAARIIILPNNRNIILTAQQAAQFAAAREVRIIPTTTILQGISALLAASDPPPGDSAAFERLVAQMTAASRSVRSIEITRATRAAQLQGIDIRAGDFLALVDGTLCAADRELTAALLAAFGDLGSGDWELATLYYGADMTQAAAEALLARLSDALPHLEFDALYGGQALYPLLISLE